MNDNAMSWTTAELDRLVDGEIQGAEYQALLRRLDSTSDGWKQCALAFLEAQALRQDLTGLAREEACRAAPSPTPRAAAMIPSWAWPLAVAACLLGMLTLQRTNPSRTQTAPPPAAPPTTNPTTSAPRNALASDTRPGGQPDGHLLLTVGDDEQQAGREVSIPFYTANNYPLEDPDEMSAELRDFLQRRGGAVGLERIWQPMVLEDGGQVLVPIDRYFVRPPRAY